ncbi:4Fe-4S binding protein [bacterium]|nr:4Fe-4S binding protein [bacterium]
MNKIKIVVIIIFSLIFVSSLFSKRDYPENAYHISEVECVKCEDCISICPVQAISIQSGRAVIDQEKCIQCGICVNGNFYDYEGCPVKAIWVKSQFEEDDFTDESLGE